MKKLKLLWKQHSLWRLSVMVTLMIWLVVGGSLVSIYVLSIQPIVNSQKVLLNQHIQQIQSAQQADTALDITSVISSFLNSPQGFITAAKDKDGNIYGALSHFPRSLPLCPDMGTFPVWSGFETDIALLDGCRFEVGDYQVVVATNNQFLTEIRENFLHAAAITLIVSFFISLIPSWIVRRKIKQQLTSVHSVVSQIEQGQFSGRIQTSGNQDEWDKIGKNINALLDNMEESVNQIQGVTDAIAHDLRTPLTRLKNKLYQLEDMSAQAGVNESIQEIQSEFNDLLVTFNAMLELSKLESLQVQKQFKSLNLATIVEDAVELIQPQIEEKDQTISVAVEDFEMLGERSLLFRAIYNIIDNANKYCDSNAHINVILEQSVLIIQDDGMGIPSEQHDLVFQRLYRLDKSRNSKGYGLGLALVKTVAKLHNAPISLGYTDGITSKGLKVEIEFKKING